VPTTHIRARSRDPATANPAALGVFLWSEVLHLHACFVFCRWSRLFFLRHTIPLCFGLVVGGGLRRRIDDRHGRSVLQSGHPGGLISPSDAPAFDVLDLQLAHLSFCFDALTLPPLLTPRVPRIGRRSLEWQNTRLARPINFS